MITRALPGALQQQRWLSAADCSAPSTLSTASRPAPPQPPQQQLLSSPAFGWPLPGARRGAMLQPGLAQHRASLRLRSVASASTRPFASPSPDSGLRHPESGASDPVASSSSSSSSSSEASSSRDSEHDASSSSTNGTSQAHHLNGSSRPQDLNGHSAPPAQGVGSSSSSSSSGTGAAGGLAVVKGGAGPAGIAAVAAGAKKPAPKFPHRWRTVFMMAAAFVLCNMDKVNMSVAVIPMASELGWSATERGLVSSSFFWGYSLTQMPAGWISTKIGGARVLIAGVALWSFGTLLAPPAAQISIYALCASRMLVGLGEGFAPSAATSVMAATIPPAERSRAVTTVFGGLDVGSAIGLMISGPLIARYGWPSVFYLFAAIGGIWCFFWPMFKPDQEDDVMKDFDEYGNAAVPGAEGAAAVAVAVTANPHAAPAVAIPPTAVPWGEFFACPAVWAVTVAHFCFNWGYYTLLAWLPSYFELALGLNVKESSFLTLIPYVAMTVMTPFVGPIADGMVQRGVSLTNVRKICQGIAFAGPALCMVACGLLTPLNSSAASSGTPVALLVGLLSVGFALGAWSRAGLYCNHQDLSPKYAGALLGITNTAGALPGVLGVTAAGMMLDATNSWSMALFYPTAVCQLLGLIFYSIFASSERQKWR